MGGGRVWLEIRVWVEAGVWVEISVLMGAEVWLQDHVDSEGLSPLKQPAVFVL